MKSTKLFFLLFFVYCFTAIPAFSQVHIGGHLSSNLMLVDETVYVDSSLYNEGYEVYFENCKIYVAANKQFIIKRGSFTIEGSTNEMRGQSGARWFGLKADSAIVYIEGTRIYDVKKQYADNLYYALYLTNPLNFQLRSSSVNPISATDSSTSGILVIYSTGIPFTPVLIIDSDSIKVNYEGNYAVNIDSYSSISGTFNITNNYIKSVNGGGSAVVLVGLEDAVVNTNTIREWGFSVYGYSSTISMWSNYINSTDSYHQVWGESGATLDLSSAAGGYNTVLTDGGRCIHVDASYFDTHNGGNYFAKLDTSISTFFDGYFPTNAYSTNQDARGNCFFNQLWTHMDSAAIRFNVKLPNQSQVYFRLLPFGDCGDSYNLLSTLSNEQKSITDNLYSQMLKEFKEKNYSAALENCMKILDLSGDDMRSIISVRKLFQINSLISKTENERLTNFGNLKSIYMKYLSSENISKNVSDELSYYVQKCNSAAGNYAEALIGYRNLLNNSQSDKQMLLKWEYEGLKSFLNSEGKMSFPDAMSSAEISQMIQEDLKQKFAGNKNGLVNNETKNFVNSGISMEQNYPNPFNPVTNIKYNLKNPGFVTLKIYNVLGKLVSELVNEFKPAGSYSVAFDGSKLSSGVYYYKIESGNNTETRRMILVK
jgi:hypothetical protein